MTSRAFLVCVAALYTVCRVASAGEEIRQTTSLTISRIEPLSAERALILWRGQFAGDDDLRIMANESGWSGFVKRGGCPFDRYWFVIEGLEPRRDYRIKLTRASDSDSSDSGVVFNYHHTEPLVEWVFIPGGQFQIGGSGEDELPRSTVHLSSYLLSATEITNADYAKYCVATRKPAPNDPGFSSSGNYLDGCPRCPVVNVSWNEAVAYCDWLSDQMNLSNFDVRTLQPRAKDGVRLPSETEWEHAASLAGGEYPWGNAAADTTRANFTVDSTAETLANRGPLAVKSFPPTTVGLYDLSGNVWEWCHDWYAAGFDSTSGMSDPFGPSQGRQKVVRGGSWADTADMLKVRNRGRLSPISSLSTVGFRVARFCTQFDDFMDTTAAERHHDTTK
jgi:formylglycine-generating enzyme required for sulfatase activity